MPRHALLIGTNRYRCRPFSLLTWPAVELHELHAVLTAPEIGGFEAQRPLCDQPAFHLAMELESFFRDRERDDLLLLCLAGHVLVDRHGAAFLITHGTEHRRWRSSVIDFAFLRDVMDQCGSEQQVVILDCVFGSFGAAAPALGTPVDIEAALGGRGRALITATNSVRYQLHDGGASGDTKAAVLTRSMVRGLRTGEADLDGDGRICLDDLALYAQAGRAEPKALLRQGRSGPVAPSPVIARRPDAAPKEPAPLAHVTLSPEPRSALGHEPRATVPPSSGALGRWNWASHAASSVASWLAEHVGR